VAWASVAGASTVGTVTSAFAETGLAAFGALGAFASFDALGSAGAFASFGSFGSAATFADLGTFAAFTDSPAGADGVSTTFFVSFFGAILFDLVATVLEASI
jgi:hypothetical protein